MSGFFAFIVVFFVGLIALITWISLHSYIHKHNKQTSILGFFLILGIVVVVLELISGFEFISEDSGLPLRHLYFALVALLFSYAIIPSLKIHIALLWVCLFVWQWTDNFNHLLPAVVVLLFLQLAGFNALQDVSKKSKRSFKAVEKGYLEINRIFRDEIALTLKWLAHFFERQ